MAGNEPGLSNLGPLDGRYRRIAEPLAGIFSEQSLIHHRYLVEIDWLAELHSLLGAEMALDKEQLSTILSLRDADASEIASSVKAIEERTRHDVKAVELHIAERLEEAGLAQIVPLVHLGCTSWDINNISYALMLRKANEEVVVPGLRALQERLEELAVAYAQHAMLGHTHGQPASPTTLGKELRVFAVRLERQVDMLQGHVFQAKLNGAVGNLSAHMAASTEIDWMSATCEFVEGLGLGWASHTTQVGPYDSMVEYFDTLARANRVLLDLASDASSYMSLGYLRLQTHEGEVGSSTMPHKVNPIDFENAEGNLEMANALLRLFAERLQVSRLQRDLSDSTIARNFGVALGHVQVAATSLHKGLAELNADRDAMLADLDRNWQVLAEAVQTKLRVSGDPQAYEKLKQATRGLGKIDERGYRDLVEKIVPKGKARDALLALRPEDCVGESVRLARSGRSDETTIPGKT